MAGNSKRQGLALSRDSEIWLLVGLVVVLGFTAGSAVVDVMSNAAQSVVDKLAYAIALAEGFFVSGSRPQRNHNPGDLERDVTGRAVGRDGPYVVYASDNDGWDALKLQVGLMFGGSHIYTPDMSIADVASHYTATDQTAWASIVAGSLGVTPDTLLQDLT